ncbi:MAG: TRAP transporter small permease [Betaproteobacteria bacterium]|nr:TRAP transporter small permease [Betaproteobacteria bacterium]
MSEQAPSKKRGPLPPGHDLIDAIFPGLAGLWTGWVLAIAAASVLFSMMLITFIDVAGRKLFVKPLYGGYEITEFLMGMLIFCALPLVTAREGHVTIDVFDRMVPEHFRRWQQVVVTAISTIALAYIAWRLWELSFDLVKNREVTMTLHIPHGPFARLFAVMSALSALASLVILWRYLCGTRKVREPAIGEGG